MLKKSLLASILISITISLTGFAQTDELLEIISVDACDCIKKMPDDVDQDSFGDKFDVCLTDYFNENAEMLSLYSESIDGDLDLSELGEEFGTKLGKKLINSCPIFLERITDMQERAGSKFYEELLRGNSLMKTQGCEAANEVYSKIINANDQVPDSTLATTYNNRGYCKTQLGDYYGAIGDLNYTISMVPNFPIAYNHRGDAKRNLGDYTNAISDYTKAIELNSSYALAYNGRGLSYYYLGKHEEAYSNYNSVLSLDSTSAYIYYNIGLVDNFVEDYQSAIENFGKVYELNPSFTDLSYYMSEAYMGLNLFDEAINVLLADSLTMTDEYNLAEVGKSYYFKESYGNAIEYLTQSININSNWYYPYLYRAYSYQDSSLYELSLSDFSRAFDLDSSYSEIPFYHGYSLYQLGDYEQSINLFTKAIKITNNYAEAFDFRARAKFKSENFKGAVDDFSSSLNLYPNDPNIYKERGEAYLKLDDKTKACADFSLAKQLGIEDEEEKELLESLMSENCSDD